MFTGLLIPRWFNCVGALCAVVITQQYGKTSEKPTGQKRKEKSWCTFSAEKQQCLAVRRNVAVNVDRTLGI